MAKPNLKLVAPITEIQTVPRTTPLRLPNSHYRKREHLTQDEVDRLIDAAKRGRHGFRDALMLLTCFRHAFRASEICSLKWSQISFDEASMHVVRCKGGVASTHPIVADE